MACNVNQRKAGVAVLISDKVDFKTKNLTKDSQNHFIIIRESIHREDITTLNIYAPKRFKIQETKTDRITRRNRPIGNYNQRFQSSCLDN